MSKVIISLDISVCRILMFKYKMERMSICCVGRNLKLTVSISNCWRMLQRLKTEILWKKQLSQVKQYQKQQHLRMRWPGRGHCVIERGSPQWGEGHGSMNQPFSEVLDIKRMESLTLFLEFQGLLGWGYYLIMLPFRFTYYTILDIFRYVPLFICYQPQSIGFEADTDQSKLDAQSFLTSQFVIKLNVLPTLFFYSKKHVLNCCIVEGIINDFKLVLAIVCKNQINLPVFVGLSPPLTMFVTATFLS